VPVNVLGVVFGKIIAIEVIGALQTEVTKVNGDDTDCPHIPDTVTVYVPGAEVLIMAALIALLLQ
jgi:hypothetical protein